ncbi:MAG: peptide chain release factor N(5)-glutamine methyltransferase [Clostridiales bacterium]|nr:peptide chain release factor N(5)-glutamine methyltransferase [Clostridiales bacterium]
MTLQEYLKEKTELLSRSGVPEAENEAWVVLETVSGLTRSYIRFSFAKELAEVVSSEVFSSLEKTYELRSCGEPLAYIVGHAPFYDLEFSVGEGVLIPRFDTEILVETALKALGIGDFPFPETDAPIPKVSSEAPFIIYDLCTGSGCVGITIARELLKRSIPCRLLMTDISEAAASYAKKNAQEILGNKVAWEVRIADLWPDKEEKKDGATSDFRADLIVSNPPYITKDEMDDLSIEVGKHEPHLALTDGGDGLSFYKRIFEGLKDHLKDGGVFAVEHGYMQKESIRKLMPGYITDVVSVKDYGDNDRVTCGRYEETL